MQQATEAREPQLLSPRTESRALQRERPRRETCVVPQSSPHSRQQESPHTAAKTQCNRQTNQEKRMVTMVKYMSCVFATTKIKKKKNW